jgi:hypothetical protein
LGGLGSGNWYRAGKKTTTGECHGVDVRYLHREGLLKSGRWFSLRWSRAGKETGSIRGVVEGSGKPERVILSYRQRRGMTDEWKDVREPVDLSWTACNYGGKRPWFICPGVVNGVACGRRVAVLYGPGEYFLCRHCHDLTYESQREGKMYRALHKAQGIRERLGGSANMTLSFPERPKGMHHKTYRRLREEHDEAQMIELMGMSKWLDKLQSKAG